MYRRRRPVLGTALLVGAVSAGTNRAINKQQTQATMTAQQQEIQKQAQEKAALENKHKEEKAAWEKEKADQKAKEERAAWEADMEAKYGRGPGFPDRPPAYEGNGAAAGGGERKFCPSCGKGYTLGANFCTSCGSKLGGN